MSKVFTAKPNTTPVPPLREKNVIIFRTPTRDDFVGQIEERSFLIDGKIPPQTVCPFRVICNIAIAGRCRHGGFKHPGTFSCASARGYDLTHASIMQPHQTYKEVS